MKLLTRNHHQHQGNVLLIDIHVPSELLPSPICTSLTSIQVAVEHVIAALCWFPFRQVIFEGVLIGFVLAGGGDDCGDAMIDQFLVIVL